MGRTLLFCLMRTLLIHDESEVNESELNLTIPSCIPPGAVSIEWSWGVVSKDRDVQCVINLSA